MSTFCSSRWVAKLCRSVCRETRLSIPAACAAAWQARLSWRVVSGLTGLLPGKQPALWPRRLPPGAQQLEQMRGQHHVAVLAALALLDPDHHAGAVDVADLERDHFGGAQARAIGHAQRRPVLEARARLRRKRATSSGLSTTGSLRGSRTNGMRSRDLAARERHREEEPQRRHCRVLARNRDAAGGQMQLIAPQVLRARLVRRAAKEDGEVPDGTDVGCLRLRRRTCGSSCPRSCAGATG